MYAKSMLGEEVDYQEVLETAEKILLTSPPLWISFDMQFFRWAISVHHARGSPIEDESLEALERLINQNQDLECFSSYLYDARSYRAVIDGNPGEALQFAQLAIEKAREYDNKMHLAYMLTMMANLDLTNHEEAELLLREAKEISEELDDQHALSNVLEMIARICEIRGEYATAIEFLSKVISIIESRESPLTTLPHNVARLYCELEDGENALEWALMTEDSLQARPHLLVYASLDKARALIQLKRLDEAAGYLADSKSKAFEGGFETQLGYYYFVEGLFERAKENLEIAMESFEQSLEISERINRQSNVNSCLLRLAETAILLAKRDESEPTSKWCSKLEEIAKEHNYVGLHSHALILRAEGRLVSGKRDEAIQAIEEATEIAEGSDMQYLLDKISAVREQLE
jgi:tetratricopeptide (TPR) repeat protein